MKRLCMPAHQTNRLNSQACLDALKRNHPILLRVHSRRRVVRHAATATARRDPFETLGIPRSASLKEVKKAYRKRALKLHPDVNKQPNAREQFMECKNAYLEIVDALERDANRSRGGTSFRDKAAGSDRARGTTRSSASSSAETEFYGLENLINDLGKEWSEYSRQRSRSSSDGPKSLWEELADIGEEFVEFLEKGVGLEATDQRDSNSSPNSSPQDGMKYDSTSESPFENKTNQNRDTVSGEKPKGDDAKSREVIIEEELQALKKKLGLK